MGGEIGFHSKEGSGSSFWFCVTLPRSEAPELLREPASGGSASGAYILLVEDLPMNQELAKAMIGRMGHRIDVAGDGVAALKAVAERDYDLILMDIQMPKMDGITATKRIRALGGGFADLPIIAMTANVMPEQVREFFGAGMNGHVAKPVRQAELHAAIVSALAGRRRLASQPAAVAEEAAPETPAFDAATFADVRGMLPPERLSVHLESLASLVERVAQGTEGEGGAAELISAAHKIVSQAGMIGLPRLSERARAVEEAARSENISGLTDTLASFREAALDVAQAEAALR
jgi:CheY-like chemotaxis protein/HPt (histidine-containing phosphotransfer) domain-containing protein